MDYRNEFAGWDIRALAEQAYEAYGSITDHKNYAGLPMPDWDELGEKIQSAWIEATYHTVKMVG